MKQKYFLTMIVVAVIAISAATSTTAVVIHQVLYDPLGTETGGEAVELYNDQSTAVDISGWIIKSEGSARDATIPGNTMLFPGDYYLIVDANWTTQRDNPSWRNADHEEAISLYNTDSGVALKNGSIVIDAVSWGVVTDPELVEGTSANHTQPGNVLLRTRDTNNNAEDFIEAAADFNERPQNGRVEFEIPVGGVANGSITIHSVILTDDLSDPGFQIIPNPGRNKTVQIIVNATGNGSLTLSGEIEKQEELVEISFTQNGTLYSGSFDIEYSDDPGLYTLVLNAQDASQTIRLNTTFEYLSLIALSIDASRLTFPAANPGSLVTLLGDNDEQTLNAATIRNIGNLPIHIGLSAAAVSNNAQFPVSQISCSLDNDFNSPLSITLGNTIQVIDRDLQPSQTTPLGFRVSIPQSQQSGLISGIAMITGVATE